MILWTPMPSRPPEDPFTAGLFGPTLIERWRGLAVELGRQTRNRANRGAHSISRPASNLMAGRDNTSDR